MTVRTIALAAAAAVLASTPLLAPPPASASVFSRVTGAPSTDSPAAGFEVPVRGVVSPGVPGRVVELKARVNHRWLTVSRTRTNGRYTLWVVAPAQR